MARKIFVNLAVKDLDKSVEFFTKLGFEALEIGGSPANDPTDYGFMYGRSFQDLDGHLWELIWMDPSALDS